MADLTNTNNGSNGTTIPTLATVLGLSAETLNLFGINPDEPAGELPEAAISTYRRAILSGMQSETISEEIRAEVRNTDWGREAPLPAAPEEDNEEELEIAAPIVASPPARSSTSWEFWRERRSSRDEREEDEEELFGRHRRHDCYANTSLEAIPRPQRLRRFNERGSTAIDADGARVQVFEAWDLVSPPLWVVEEDIEPEEVLNYEGLAAFDEMGGRLVTEE